MKALLVFLLLLIARPIHGQADTSYYRPAYRSYADSLKVLNRRIVEQDTTINRQNREIQFDRMARQRSENSSVAIVTTIIVGALVTLGSLFMH